jgi:hypothetical protein
MAEIGDPVGFGEDLCELSVTRLTRLARQTKALAVARGRTGAKAKYYQLDVRRQYRVSSSEHAVLRQILVPEGEEAITGQALALLSTVPDETVPRDVESVKANLRVVANLTSPTEEQI